MVVASDLVLIAAKHHSMGTQVVVSLQKLGINAVLREQGEEVQCEPGVSCAVLTVSGSVTEQDGILYVPETLDAESICTIIQLKLHHESQQSSLEPMASVILQTVGIHPNLKGYVYLKAAIILAAEQEELVYQISSLYQMVAQRYGVSTGGVERAIRHAIDMAYDTGAEQLQRFFRYPVEKPSNSELIAQAADRLRMQMLTDKYGV